MGGLAAMVDEELVESTVIDVEDCKAATLFSAEVHALMVSR